MNTNQYYLTIIKIRYCQEQYLHDQQQIDNEKTQKYKCLCIAKKHKDPSYQQENFQDNSDTQKSPERNICIKDCT